MMTNILYSHEQIENMLRMFVDKYIKLMPAQRSAEWFEMRKNKVGGSEVASLINLNPYQNYRTFFEKKAGLGTDSYGASCWWGTLLEDICQEYIEYDLDTKVYGNNVYIPVTEYFGVSPDGLCVIRFNKYEEYLDENGFHEGFSEIRTKKNSNDTRKHEIISVPVVAEFKSPHRRKPKGIVPKYYTPQVWSELMSVPMATVGLFVEAVFRKCPLNKLQFNKFYDFCYHDKEYNTFDKPVAVGIIGIYYNDGDEDVLNVVKNCNMVYDIEGNLISSKKAQTNFDELYSESEDDDTKTYSGQNIIDIGSSDKKVFEKILELINSKKIKTETSPFWTTEKQHNIKKTFDILKKKHKNLFAIFPWKLFSVDYNLVDRNHSFEKTIGEKTKKFIESVKIVRDSENPTEEFLKLFGEESQKKISSDTQSLFDCL
jgi:hypothetical protein